MTEALQTYTILSIGDGLVTQIPAIIVSIAAGILVTRSSEESDLGEFVGRQLTVYPRAVAICGVMLMLFAFFLSETFWPFFLLSDGVLCRSLSFLQKSRLGIFHRGLAVPIRPLGALVHPGPLPLPGVPARMRAHSFHPWRMR